MPKPRRPFDITRTPPSHLREFIDHDYLDRLSDEERAWLAAFDSAYYEGRGDPSKCAGDKIAKASGRMGRQHHDKAAGNARMHAARRDVYNKRTRIDIKNMDENASKGEEE